MKKFSPYLITAGIALGVVIFWPKIRPMAQKIPVLGALIP